MVKNRISATVDDNTIKLIDKIFSGGKYRNKSHLIESVISKFAEDIENEK